MRRLRLQQRACSFCAPQAFQTDLTFIDNACDVLCPAHTVFFCNTWLHSMLAQLAGLLFFAYF